MTTYIEYVFFIICLLLIVKPLGTYIFNVFEEKKTGCDFLFKPIEKSIYYITGVSTEHEQSWTQYTMSLLIFSFMSLLLLMLILLFQRHLPENLMHLPSLSFGETFNTAASFVGNTNWQSYAGETTMSYFSQMVGLAVQNFLSAAVGISVAIALIRSFARKNCQTIRNFWVDLTRSILWILLPISIVLAIIYIAQGVPQNFMHYVHVTTLNGGHQLIPQGPIASQEAIKSLGTNGGGFFNVNSAHPYENPTGLTNFLQAFSIFAIGAALTYTFGLYVNNTKQGWTILSAMLVLFILGLGVMHFSESHVNAHLSDYMVHGHQAINTAAGNLEGKETRFGVSSSVLYNEVSTAASDGGVNSMFDSYMPIGGAVGLFNMAIGEVVVGGVGAGLYSILMYVILTVFIAGLMVGRTPTFLGKKIEANEMKLAIFSLLISPFVVLLMTSIACLVPSAVSSTLNHGPHGFTEILYAYTSAANNNGSAFSGLNANTNFYNISLGLAILIGRFLMIIPIIAIAGSFAQKPKVPSTSGTLSTSGFLFSGLLVGVILLISGLTFFPALSLGPLAEHLAMNAGLLY